MFFKAFYLRIVSDVASGAFNNGERPKEVFYYPSKNPRNATESGDDGTLSLKLSPKNIEPYSVSDYTLILDPSKQSGRSAAPDKIVWDLNK